MSRLHIFFGRPSAHSFRLIADLVSFSRYCHHLLESLIVGGLGLGILLVWGFDVLALLAILFATKCLGRP